MGGGDKVELSDLLTIAVVVGGYNLAAWRLKKAIVRIDPSSHPWRLQLRDFKVVKEARDRAVNPADVRRLTRLLYGMALTAATAPLVIVSWVVITATMR